MSDDLLDELNPAQRLAVTTTNGPLLIIAGAGSGKTRVITYRIAYLVRECGVGPNRILAATFTNKAAEQMRERVASLICAPRQMPFAISTFHAWCAGVLRREAEKVGISRDFTICDEEDQLSVLKEVFRGLGLDPRRAPILPTQARWVIEQAKIRLEGPQDVLEQSSDRDRGALYARIFEAYQEMLRRNNALDFGDLLAEVVHLFETDKATLETYQDQYRYLMVDEYQDTNHVQWRLISALASKYRNICVVGDEDQSIYGWRGADLANLFDFQNQFPDAKLIRLEQNYRSTQNILTVASEVIARNKQRLGKALWTDRGNGPPVLAFEAMGERDEADRIVRLIEWFHTRCFIPYGEMAVFYRVNALSRLIEERLRGAGIPYRVIGGVRFYDRKEIKDLLAYLRVIANPYDSMALARIINTPRRGIGQKTIEKIVERALRNSLSFFEAIEQMRRERRLPRGAERKVADFVEQLNRWAQLARTASIAELLETVLQDTGYIESLGDPASLEVISRRENIDELKNAIVQFERERPDATLRDFLEYTSLRASVDEYEADDNSVSLMTIHCAKGLEFRVVFMIALEKDVFPHVLSLQEGNLEEERRLFYVGVTRAKDVLCLSYASDRCVHGEPRWTTPSIFLHEVPQEFVQFPTEEVLEEVRRELHQLGPPPSAKRPRRKPGRKKKETLAETPSAGRRNWQVGQSLVHPTLGSGKIAEIRGAGQDQILVVEFDDGQRMEFMARFARLKRQPL